MNTAPLSEGMPADETQPGQAGELLLEVRRFLKADSPVDFSLAMALRTVVFIQEQGVPAELEADEFDEEATHWLLILPETQESLATGRMLSYQEVCQARPVAKIGRIAVSQSYRGQGLGQRLMREILAHAQLAGYEQAILDAQTRAMPFYEKLGFVKEGFEFEEAGIPHYRMRLVFESLGNNSRASVLLGLDNGI
jgi:predicted GNAT family N-acyltransferase